MSNAAEYNNNEINAETPSEASTINVPASPLDSDQFEIHHYGIAKGEYEQASKNRNNKAISKRPDLFVDRRLKPSTDLFLKFVEKVGKPYGWDLREEFANSSNRPYLDKLMKQPTSHFLIFKQETEGENNLGEHNSETVGFCLLTSIPAIQVIDATALNNVSQIDMLDSVERFKLAARQPSDATAIEINKIGLFPEHTNKELGQIFLAHVLNYAFETSNANMVVLNTRTTNHRGVNSFYTGNGLIDYHSEKIRNDLVNREQPTANQNASSHPAPAE